MPGRNLFSRLRSGSSSSLQKRKNKSKRDLWTNQPTTSARVVSGESDVVYPFLRVDYEKNQAASEALRAMVAAALRNEADEKKKDNDSATTKSYGSYLVELDEARRTGVPKYVHTRHEKNEDKLKAHLHRQSEEAGMRSTLGGQSWLLAREILQIHEKHKTFIGPRDINPVAVDDLVILAQRFLKCHETIAKAGRPPLVTIAYHYTRSSSMGSIRENGLMTPEDQRKHNVISGRTAAGGTYGPGIYLSSNPYAFHSFNGGNVGLMVAVIYGETRRVKDAREAGLEKNTYDTIVGNKNWEPSFDRLSDRHCHFSDEYVLQKSAQCLPLFRFDSNVIDKNGTGRRTVSSGGNEVLWAIHQDCQKIFDSFMNCGAPTNLVRVLPTDSRMVIKGSLGAVSHDQSRYPKTGNQHPAHVREILRYEAPDTKEHSIRCTQCSSFTTLIHGESPSGTMTVWRFSDAEPDDFDDDGNPQAIVITYHIPSAHQNSYHPSPGRRFCGTSKTAYLPDNDEGRALLLRLKYAWLHGHTFHVGNSIPYVAFSSIPHKWRVPGGGDNVCPDDNFISEANKKLDEIGVPPVPVMNDVNVASAPRTITTATRATMARCASSPRLAERRNAQLSDVTNNQVLKYTAPDRVPRAPPIVTAPCPTCGASQFSTGIGASPSGKMTITRSSKVKLKGFEHTTNHTFTIQYDLEGGVQKSYHPNPGVSFAGTSRTAYVPDNDMGRMLLDRLKYAWLHGLTFTVGRSMTTGRDNVITWSSISHKTSLGGGLHGFPDNNYFTKVNAELDAAGVPPDSSACSTLGSSTDTDKEPHASRTRWAALISSDESSSTSSTDMNQKANRKLISGAGLVGRTKYERRLAFCSPSRSSPCWVEKPCAEAKKSPHMSGNKSAGNVGDGAISWPGDLSSDESSSTSSSEMDTNVPQKNVVPFVWTASGRRLGDTSPNDSNSNADSKPSRTAAQNARVGQDTLRPSRISVARGVEETPRIVTAPSTIVLDIPDEQVVTYNAPETLLPSTRNADTFCDRVPFRTSLTDDCAVCLEPLNSAKRVVRLRRCRHDFHEDCIELMKQSGNFSACPICRKALVDGVTASGASPSGTMKISRSKTTQCGGFPRGTATFVITYHLPKGVQKSYHPSPGLPFSSTTRTAYLPDTMEGRQVLVRLRYAWQHGLSFLIGTSMTTGMKNVIVWSSIHHKTSVKGQDPHCFPDPNYFSNVNKELSNLNVPSWDECQKWKCKKESF